MSNGPMRIAALAAVAGAAALLVLAQTAPGQAIEQQYVTPSTGSDFQYFGDSIDTQGDLMVVGSPQDDTKNHDAGAVYVYRFVAGGWTLEQKLFASDYQYGATFGSAVALDGDTIAVAAVSQSTSLGAYAGQAYVFRWDPATKLWSEEQKLLPSVGATNDEFGYSIDISGDLVLVGSPQLDTAAGTDTGAAFVFRYHDPTVKWAEEAKLIDSDAKQDDRAGRSVSIDGSTAVVSASLADEGALDQGTVSVFTVSGTTWTETAELTIANTHTFNDFGDSVAISGNRIVAGAEGQDLGTSVGDVGYIYIFEFNGSSWLQVASFANPNPTPSSYFGSRVAISGDVVLVGHPDNDTSGMSDAGSAWIYRRGNQTGWVFDGQLVASDAHDGDRFGTAVAVSSDHIVCGASRNDTAAGTDWGVVYGYAADGITLTLAPSNPAPGQPITLSAFRGATGAPVLLTVEEISGTPVFLPLFVAAFGVDNTFTFTTNAPNPAYGLHVGMRAWKVSPTGPLVHSDLAYVDV